MPDDWQHDDDWNAAELRAIFNEVELVDQQREDMEFLGVTLQREGFLRSHSTKFARLHQELNRPGIFKTISSGTDPEQPNLFAFPIANGGWNLIRYGKGTIEADTWTTSASGWTQCRFGVPASLEIAMKHSDAARTEKGWFLHDDEQFLRFTEAIGTDIPPVGGPYTITTKDRRIIIKAPLQADIPRGWGKEGRSLVATIADPTPLIELDLYVRCYRTDGQKSLWGYFDRRHVFHLADRQSAVDSLFGYGIPNVQREIGRATNSPWAIDATPFAGEYPGGRKVHGIFAAQLAEAPSSDPQPTPTWDSIYQHLGQSLDEPVRANQWCQERGVLTGQDYLFLWSANLFQHPERPLPYLFAYGCQEGGKSKFQEAHRLLMTRGVAECDEALQSSIGYNGTMAGAVFCYVEETPIGKSSTAYARIKRWTTSPTITIRKMHTDGFELPNYTHWYQSANDISACPIFEGDTRVVMFEALAYPKEKRLAPHELEKRLIAERADFLGRLIQAELPASNERLYLPVLDTQEKREALRTPLKDALAVLAGQTLLTQDIFDAIPPGTATNVDRLGRDLSELGCKKMGRSQWRIPDDFYSTSA